MKNKNLTATRISGFIILLTVILSVSFNSMRIANAQDSDTPIASVTVYTTPPDSSQSYWLIVYNFFFRRGEPSKDPIFDPAKRKQKENATCENNGGLDRPNAEMLKAVIGTLAYDMIFVNSQMIAEEMQNESSNPYGCFARAFRGFFNSATGLGKNICTATLDRAVDPTILKNDILKAWTLYGKLKTGIDNALAHKKAFADKVLGSISNACVRKADAILHPQSEAETRAIVNALNEVFCSTVATIPLGLLKGPLAAGRTQSLIDAVHGINEEEFIAEVVAKVDTAVEELTPAAPVITPEISQKIASEIKEIKTDADMVLPLLKDRYGDTACLEPQCTAMGPGLLGIIHHYYPTMENASTMHYAIYTLADGTKKRFGNAHQFLVMMVEGTGKEIIVDPTYKQFFSDQSLLKGERDIFVGTSEDLQALFSKYATNISYSLGRAPVEGLDSNLFTENTWGFGRGSAFRQACGLFH
jgi:hypothetical protein